MTGFYPYKNLPEGKLKSFRLMTLAEETSRQPDIESFKWLLVIALMQIYKVSGNVDKEKQM